MERKCKQRRLTISPMSKNKQPLIKSLNIEKKRQMTLEIQYHGWDRLINVAELSGKTWD